MQALGGMQNSYYTRLALQPRLDDVERVQEQHRKRARHAASYHVVVALPGVLVLPSIPARSGWHGRGRRACGPGWGRCR